LLAGDRSLADVVAHEIAHSWTGNLVTNATWDHFWLNEGWTTWFQRKIMARIHKDDRFLDFDALGGYKTLQDTIDREMPQEFQRLVLHIGTNDPDESYSSVAYEKGFNLLYALEKRVGKDAFEQFFQKYVANFAYKTLTSDDFRDFAQQHLGEPISDFDWPTWFHTPGMPPEVPQFDTTLAAASERLARHWVATDRNGCMLPTQNISSWSSLQITCFLDALQVQLGSQPLQQSTLRCMNQLYKFADSRNSEILFRYCELAIAAGDTSILPVVVHFITSQGRMKFTRPLYRALYASVMGKDLAVSTFLAHKDFYHPICAKMIASDLRIERTNSSERALSLAEWLPTVTWTLAVAAGVAVVGISLARRQKR
jgi:leukotriene-A4 hydrolase